MPRDPAVLSAGPSCPREKRPPTWPNFPGNQPGTTPQCTPPGLQSQLLESALVLATETRDSLTAGRAGERQRAGGQGNGALLMAPLQQGWGRVKSGLKLRGKTVGGGTRPGGRLREGAGWPLSGCGLGEATRWGGVRRGGQEAGPGGGLRSLTGNVCLLGEGTSRARGEGARGGCGHARKGPRPVAWAATRRARRLGRGGTERWPGRRSRREGKKG